MNTLARIGIALIVIAPSVSFAQVAPPSPPPPPIPTVSVTDTCTPATTGGVSHTYTAQFLGICALLAAKDQSAVSGYSLSSYDPVFGFFLESINSVLPGATEFWAVDKDGDDSLGLSSMTIAQENIITFQLTDWTTSTTIGDPVRFKIGTLTAIPAEPTPSASGGSGGIWMHAPFDVPAALLYLESVQNPDGSFGSPMLNDWVAIASALGESPALRAKLVAYEVAHPVISTIVTDNERHAMALQALGVNPYTGTPVDYIEPIVRSFDGTQFGDPSLVNDDIFAVFPLLHAGYEKNDPLIASTTAFILSKQGTNGLWNDSVDLTAAAIQALALVPNSGEVRYAISKATGNLRDKQHDDGSFGDPYSSSWMLQAIAALGGTASDWQQHSYTPDYYLATMQDGDGGVQASSTNDRVWATSYAIPAIRRATWDSLLTSFAKPLPITTPTPAATSTTETATSTEPTATTAPDGTASTPEATPAAVQDSPVAPAEPAQITISSSSNATGTSGQTASVANTARKLSPLEYLGLVLLLLILAGVSVWTRRRRS